MADSAIAVTAGTGTNVDTRTEGTNGNHRQVIIIGDPATNAGVAPVDATAGLKVDLGADNDVVISDGGNTITVDGTVAVTNAALTELAGAIDTEVQVDVVSSALPSGAATSANQSTVIGHLDGVETLLGTIDADTGTLAGAVSGSEMQVDVVAALPAGTNAIGKLAANSGVDIGDVDVTSLPSTVHSADYDSGAGTDTTLAFGIAVPASGGAAVITGDASNGLDVDVTRVSGTVTVDGSGVTQPVSNAALTELAAAINDSKVDVNIASGSSSGTEYTEGDTDASITGSAILWEDASDTLRAVSAAKPLPVDIQDSTIAVTQSGTWDEVGIHDSGNSITVDATNLDIRDLAAASDSVTIHGDVGAIDQLDLTNSNPVTVAIVDDSGDQISSFGGGVQYTEGDTDSTITGTAMLAESAGADNTLLTLRVDNGTNHNLKTVDAYSSTIANSIGVVEIAMHAGDSAAANDDLGAALVAVRDDALSTVTPAEGDYNLLRTNAEGALWVKPSGTVTVDGSGVTQPVSGTVTANLSATDNAVLDDIAADTESIKTAVEIIDNAISGNEMQVDVLSVVPGTGATNLGKAEDAAHSSGDVGVMALGVFNESGTDFSTTDKDYVPFALSSQGYLNIIGQGGNIGEVSQSFGYDQGFTAHDNDVTADYPIKIGGQAKATAPSAVSTDGDAVNAWFDLNGRLQIGDGGQTLSIDDGSGAITVDNAGTFAVQSTIQAGTNAIGKLLPPDIDVTAHTNYAKKYYTNSGAVTDGIVWSPAAGKRWHVVSMYIQTSADATVTLEDDKSGGDEAVWKAELAAKSGMTINFGEKYPLASGEDAADLIVTTSAGNIYITITGYEI